MSYKNDRPIKCDLALWAGVVGGTPETSATMFRCNIIAKISILIRIFLIISPMVIIVVLTTLRWTKEPGLTAGEGELSRTTLGGAFGPGLNRGLIYFNSNTGLRLLSYGNARYTINKYDARDIYIFA